MDALDMDIYAVGIKHERIIYLKYTNAGALFICFKFLKCRLKFIIQTTNL